MSSVGIIPSNGLSVIFSSYFNNSNLYSGGGIPSETCVYVAPFTGNGKSSTIQTLLTAPPVFQPTIMVSQVPDFIVKLSIDIGTTCSPPIFPIFPQDFASNALGPFPPELPSDVAKADNHATEDLNAPR